MTQLNLLKASSVYNKYNYLHGEICFISTQNFSYSRKPSPELIQLLLRVRRNNGRLLERELVGINRFIMQRDYDLDTHNVTSTEIRTITIMPLLKSFLTRYEHRKCNSAIEQAS